MEKFKLGQIVYCSDAGEIWYIGHFAGMSGGDYYDYRVSASLPESLTGSGQAYRKCISFKDYHKMINAPKDKDLVWAWDDVAPFHRYAKFYDAKNNATFQATSGKRNAFCFEHYKAIKDWRNKPDFAWAIEVLENLED